MLVLDNGGKEAHILHRMDRVHVDDLRAFESEEVRCRFGHGLPKLDGEIGEVLIGDVAGRSEARERILILNLGIAACDVAIATEVYRRAVRLGRGCPLKL